MANAFTVVPFALSFDKAIVQGPVAGLYPTPQTLSFILTNNSGAPVTVTGFGFTTTTEGDGVTTPAGQLPNSDFTVVPHLTTFPVTIANSTSQQFDVTYAPLRRGSGFGDIRSALLVLFAGNKALSNGGQVLNSSGEVVNESEPKLVIVGVGGGVREEAFDNARVNPIFWTGGKGDESGQQGLAVNFTIADLDTTEHYSPMMFWTSFQNGPQTSTPRAPAPAVASSNPPYGTLTSAFVNGSPRNGRGYQVLVFTQASSTDSNPDATLTFDLVIDVNTSAGNVTVATFTGVSSKSTGLFIGNAESLDLQGLELIAVTSNFHTNGGVYNGTTLYNVGAVITG